MARILIVSLMLVSLVGCGDLRKLSTCESAIQKYEEHANTEPVMAQNYGRLLPKPK
jgi:hypothetical protein